MTIEGDSFVTNTETVEIKDNLLVINDGEKGSGVTKLYGGIEVDRGTKTNYQFLFNETNESFEVGEKDDLQNVATREDTPQTKGVPFWNDTEFRFDTDNQFTFDGNDLNIGLSSNYSNINLKGDLLGNKNDGLIKMNSPQSGYNSILELTEQDNYGLRIYHDGINNKISYGSIDSGNYVEVFNYDRNSSQLNLSGNINLNNHNINSINHVNTTYITSGNPDNSNQSNFQIDSQWQNQGYIETPWVYGNALEASGERGYKSTLITVGIVDGFTKNDEVALITNGYIGLKQDQNNDIYIPNGDLILSDSGRAYIDRQFDTNNPDISLAIGDSDTGIDWVENGYIQIYSDNAAIVDINQSKNYEVGINGKLRAFETIRSNTKFIVNNPSTGGTLELRQYKNNDGIIETTDGDLYINANGNDIYLENDTNFKANNNNITNINTVEADHHTTGNYSIEYNSTEDSLDFVYTG
jgi:hypothetical protein